MDKKVNDFEIRVTDDYEMFRRLEGNRKVLTTRVKKITDSIREVGYIPNPLIINEKFEVVDGQGRLEALKRLNLPVYYMVVDGIGIDECIAMNINQGNWSIMDYIESYAETGNVSYVNLLRLFKTYGNRFSQKVIICVISGTSDNPSNVIKAGRFQCAAERAAEATNTLEYLSNYNDIFGRLDGHTEYYYMAVAFCYRDEEIDNARLLDKITQLQANLIPVTNMMQALDQIEAAYNNRCRSKVYIKTNYQKYLDDKYRWYARKWGNKYKNEGREHEQD